MVLALTFRSMSHFELVFVYGMMQKQVFIVLKYPVLSTVFVEKTILYPVIYSDSSLVINHLTTCMCVYFRTHSMLIATPLQYCPDSFHLIEVLKSSSINSPTLFLFIKVVFTILLYFRISCQFLQKEKKGILGFRLGWCVRSVMFDSLGSHELQSARLLCPWNFPGKNTAAGCPFLLQGIVSTQKSNPHLLPLLHRQVDSLPLCHPGSC